MCAFVEDACVLAGRCCTSQDTTTAGEVFNNCYQAPVTAMDQTDTTYCCWEGDNPAISQTYGVTSCDCGSSESCGMPVFVCRGLFWSCPDGGIAGDTFISSTPGSCPAGPAVGSDPTDCCYQPLSGDWQMEAGQGIRVGSSQAASCYLAAGSMRVPVLVSPNECCL